MKNYNRLQPFLTGVYGWLNLDVDSTVLLNTIVGTIQCPVEPCNPTEYHTTMIHSENAPLSVVSPEIELVTATIKRFEMFGKYAVVVLDSPDLQSIWEAFVSQNLIWDYPTYRPHVTVAISEEVDLSNWCALLNDELQSKDLVGIELTYVPQLYWSNLN